MEEWFRSAWEGVRDAHRTSTVRTALTLLLRAAGIPVDFRAYPTYAVTVALGQEEHLQQLVAQTVAPTAIVVPSGLEIDAELKDHANARRIAIVEEIPDHVELVGAATDNLTATFYENLLVASTFADINELRTELIGTEWRQLVSLERASSHTGQVVLRRVDAPHSTGDELALVVDQPRACSGREAAADPLGIKNAGGKFGTNYDPAVGPATATSMAVSSRNSRKVLIAGHDLKFIKGIAESLVASGISIDYDTWRFHNSHDEKQSLSHLTSAEVILCESGSR